MSPLERFRYIRTLRMPGIPKAVLWCIASHADRQGFCWLLQSTLSAESGFSIRSVGAAVDLLNTRGLLIHVRHGHHASGFHLTLDAFRAAKSRSAPGAEYIQQDVPTEVAPMKRKARRIAATERRCTCGFALGDGWDCIPCHKYRESHPGITRVLPTNPSRLPVP